MRIDEITVEVRDSNFDRQGLIQPVDLATFKAVLRFNNVGTWSITLPVGHPMAEILRLPGSGVIVTGPNGVLMSGPTISATNTKTGENPNGDWEIQGVDDSQILGERLAYPTPASADVQAQTTAYDTRTGLASTVMYGYVNANLGSGAPAAREITNLYTATDAGLGTTAHAAARFDVLGELLAGIASVDGLGFDIKQVDGNLEFSVYEPVDRTGTIRMDVANNTLQKTAYGYGSPSATVAIVAGQGEGADRQFEQVVTTESTAAESLWQRRIETFIDQRNTSVVDELIQAGKEELADRGSTVTSIDVVPSSDSTMRYGIDWGLGDAVTVVVGEQEVSATVTTVAISIEADGIRVGATVGEPTGVDYDGLIAKKQTNTSKRVNALERKEGGSGGGGGGSATFVGDTAPLVTAGFDYWFKSSTGEVFFLYEDADSVQWVQINNGTVADAALTARVTTVEGRATTIEGRATALETRATTLEGVRPVSIGGTGASTLTSGEYLKGNGTSAVTSQAGIPAGDITSGILPLARGGNGNVLGPGLIPLIPTSVGMYGGGSASVSANGRILVEGGSGIYLNGIFTSAYDHYRIVVDHRNMGGAYEYFRFTSSDNNMTTASAFYGGGFYRQGGSTGIWNDTGDGYAHANIGYTGAGGGTVFEVFSPNNGIAYPRATVFNSYGTGSHTQVWSDKVWNGTSNIPGFFIYNGGATQSMIVRVYAYA